MFRNRIQNLTPVNIHISIFYHIIFKSSSLMKTLYRRNSKVSCLLLFIV